MPPLPNTAQVAFADAAEPIQQSDPPPRGRSSTAPTTSQQWEWREFEGRSVKFDLSKQQQRVRSDMKTFSQAEIKAQVAAGRLWVIIDSGVYDLTGFAARHPGGALALQHSAGHQCGDLFAEYHPASTYALLPALQVGYLAEETTGQGLSALAADRRALRQQLLAEGLFESRPIYFALVLLRAFAFMALTTLLLVLANHWASVSGQPESDAAQGWVPELMRLVAAVSFGMFFQQMAFLGHDSGHSGITHNRKVDSVIGMLAGNLCTGISMAWWKYSHNVHHIVCNSIEHDPDIQHLPFFAISRQIFDASAGLAASDSDDAVRAFPVPAANSSKKQLEPNADADAGGSACSSTPSSTPSSSSLSSDTLNVRRTAVRPSSTSAPSSITSSSSSPSVRIRSAQPWSSSWRSWSPLYFSTFHNRWMGLDALTRLVLSAQHWIYYPLMAVARFNLYFQSWLLLLVNRGRPAWRHAELVLLALHLCWHAYLLAAGLPDARTRFVFLVVSHAVAGVLHVQITLSHFAMHVYHGHRLSKFEDWCTTQLLTTMNIESTWLTDWFHGGLQFQIEHHLFPRVPRHNLRAVQKHVKAFCQRHALPYVSVTFAEANRMVFRALREAAGEAWSAPVVDLQGSMLADALHARG